MDYFHFDCRPTKNPMDKHVYMKCRQKEIMPVCTVQVDEIQKIQKYATQVFQAVASLARLKLRICRTTVSSLDSVINAIVFSSK